MNRPINHIACCTLAGLLAVVPNTDASAFTVVGEYEGEANRVDKSARFYPGNSSGMGNDASLVVNSDDFSARIQTAFAAGNGGVVDFDNGLIVGGEQTSVFTAAFGDKTLQITSVDHLRTDYITSICTPISGPGEAPSCGFLAKSNVNGDIIAIKGSYDFTFTEIGFGADEHVREVGGTILGRNGSMPGSRWLMKVTLDNGDILAMIAEIDFQSGNTRDDTFFGAKAPAGRYITGVSWISLNGTFSGLDGFAFITNGSPKVRVKPATDNTLFGIPVASDESDGGGSNSGFSSLFGSERPSSMR